MASGGKKNTMKNWALANWLDWFERQREGRAREATLGAGKADQSGSPPQQRDEARSGALSSLPAMWRRRQELQVHLERDDRPVCDRKTLSPSTTPSRLPKLHSWSCTYLHQLPGAWLSPPWHKEKQPYPRSSHEGKGRQVCLGTTGSQNPLRTRQISELTVPRARPILPNTREGKVRWTM